MTVIESSQGFRSDSEGIGNNHLAKVFTATGKLACPDICSGVFVSVKVEGKGDTVVFMSSDKYRLIEVTVDMPNVGEWLAYPNGKELAKASSLVKGQSTVSFTVSDTSVVVSSPKGSVNILAMSPYLEYPNVERFFDDSTNDDKWPETSVGYNGDLLGEMLMLISDIVNNGGKDKVANKVNISRLVPRGIVTAHREGISVRAVIMPMK